MWLRPLALETGGMRGGPAWVRVDRDDGAREVRFPERFDPFRFADGRVWGVVRDELDMPKVGWIAVFPGRVGVAHILSREVAKRAKTRRRSPLSSSVAAQCLPRLCRCASKYCL